MNTPAYKSLALLCLSSLGAACSVSHTAVVATGPPLPVVVPELEVNDFAWAPQYVGWVAGGETLFIEGSITDQGWDPRDGYQFFAETPLLVQVSLDAHVPGVDLDWCVWDPIYGGYTVCAETEFDPEMGSFLVVPPGNEFHIVVSAYAGTSTYTMTVNFSTYFGAEAAAADSGLTELEGIEGKTPRTQGVSAYGDDRRWDVPAPDSPVLQVPIFSGALFELDKD